MEPTAVLVVVTVGVVAILLQRSVVIIPRRSEYRVLRLGKDSRTLGAGSHFVIPFPDRVASRRSLEEMDDTGPNRQ